MPGFETVLELNDRLSLIHIICGRTGKDRATWKRNAYDEIYSGNSLNVCMCLTTAYITDGSH